MRNVKRFLPYVGGILLLTLLLRQIEPKEVLDRLLDANPLWLLIGCGWYLLTNILRTYRVAQILEIPGWWSPLRILPEMFALSFLNNVLPSRTGELSFPFFMAQRHQIPVATSATALLLVRIFDYLAVAILFTFFALIQRSKLLPNALQFVNIVLLALAISIVGLLAMPWLGHVGLTLMRWILSRLGFKESNLYTLADRFGTQMVTTLALMRSPLFYIQIVGWSLLVWLCTFAWFAAFLQAIGLPYPYMLVIVGATFGSLAKAIPFITIGGFGAYEAGWALGFGLTGMDRVTALSSGFTVNILILTTSIIFGGSALLFMALGQRTTGQKEPQIQTDEEAVTPNC